MQKEYLGDWTIFEGIVLTENRKLSYLDNVRDCLEKEHLFEIAAMLKREGFIPEEFWLIEYPVEGVYFFERIIQNRKIVKQRGIDFFVFLVMMEYLDHIFKQWKQMLKVATMIFHAIQLKSLLRKWNVNERGCLVS